MGGYSSLHVSGLVCYILFVFEQFLLEVWTSDNLRNVLKKTSLGLVYGGSSLLFVSFNVRELFDGKVIWAFTILVSFPVVVSSRLDKKATYIFTNSRFGTLFA